MLFQAIKRIRNELKKFFSTLFGREKSEQYVQPVFSASQSNAYVETVSNKADSFHRSIKKLYEEDFQSSYLSLLRKLVQKFRRGKIRLAIDKHEIGYYGQKNSFYLVGTSYGNKSYQKAFEYISISLLTGKKEERIHLYALPWHIGQDLTDSVAKLLNIVKPLFDKIEVVMFDRGFHCNKLIHWLNENKIPYLIHIKKQGKLFKELINHTKSFYKGKYQTKFNEDKSSFLVETTLYVCKNIDKRDWLFVSSINFKSKWQVRNLYRNRWQIETNYAINNQNRIMSKSTNYLIRYFYFLCDILIQILWRLSIFVKINFKQFLRILVVGIQQVIEMKPLLVRILT